MKLRALVSAGVALGAFVTAQGCGMLMGVSDVTEERLCTPDAYVFCRCADKSEGTKQCETDGLSFKACTTNEAGECAGGEIPDERTGAALEPGEYPSEKKQEQADALATCPGKSLSPVPGAEVTLDGDTATSKNDRKGDGSCASGDGANDHVYHVIPTGSGKLQVKVTGAKGALSPVVYLRTSCDDLTTQAACGPTDPSATAQLATNVLAGRDYYLFIDGSSATSGKYTATVKLTTSSFCGDGKIDQGEACDDTNHVDDDGCGPDCRSINGNPLSGASCPGQPVHIWLNQKVKGTGSTTAPNYTNAWSAPATSCTSGSNGYKDHIYAVTPHAAGQLTISLTPPSTGTLPNLMISARRTCEIVEAGAGMCVNAKGSGSADAFETMTISVAKDATVFVGIDGGDSQGGPYVVNFELKPAL